MVFKISSKSEVLFGPGVSAQLTQQLKEYGCQKPLVVFDQGVEKAGVIAPILDQLTKENVQFISFGEVLPDPPDSMINECGKIAREANVDSVIGIGGGSSLDTAKAVNVLLGNPGDIQRYLGPGTPHKPSRPLFLIPTTAGTGSEVTYVSVVTDTQNRAKSGVAGPATIATVAIIDPELTLALPPAITAATGMDAFAHAAEAYTSKANNLMSDLLAEKAIQLIAGSLPEAVNNGKNLDARTHMSFASMLAGMSFNDSVPHFGHAFGHTLGSLFKIPHGVGCAIAQPATIEYVAAVLPHKVAQIGNLMGMHIDQYSSAAEIGKAVSKMITDFNTKIGIPTLPQLGIEEKDLPDLAEGTMADGLFQLVPKEMSYDDVLASIRQIYSA